MSRTGWPTLLLVLAVASLAVGTRFVLPVISPGRSWAWAEPLQHALLLAALALNAVRHGTFPRITPWPAVVATGFLVLAPWIGSGAAAGAGPWPAHALAAWLVLVLPWCAAAVRFQPGTERTLAMSLASVALLSAVIGLVLHHATTWLAYGLWGDTLYRFAGATRADYFAGLAFGGVVIGVHEWQRRRSRLAGLLATLNAILLIFSGSRTSMVSALVWFLVYLAAAGRTMRGRRRFGPASWLAIAAVVVAFALYLPVLRERMFEFGDGMINLSGRREIWEALLADFRARPWFGWGLGATQPGGLLPVLPHNEGLRLLVDLGIIGTVLYLGAVLAWVLRVRPVLVDADRAFGLALLVALAVYGQTDNPISACYILPFLYLGCLVNEARDRDAPGGSAENHEQ